MRFALKSAVLVLGGCVAASALAVTTSELKELPVFSSSNHVLDLLIIAREKKIQLGDYSPRAWVYEVCYRKDASRDNACPEDGRTASEYGGMRLQLWPGDHLKIRFINQLPPAPPDAEHLGDPDGAMLAANPTNLHTHGLIVEPRQPSTSNPTYGDYVYVLAYPKGQLPQMAMPGLDVTDKPLDYDIYIPRNHPSGSFWIHPHVHGLALNQLSYGLAGIITIGGVGDYLGGPAESRVVDLDRRITVRNLVLKDMQVQADGTVLSQEDPSFCSADPDNEPARDGDCEGQDYSDDSGVHSYTGGQWIFSVNGQVHPTIHAGPQGEIWRITQASGSRTYQASLVDSATGKPIVFQVLSLDGITLDAIGGSDAMTEHSGHKFRAIPCPESLRGTDRPVCTDALHLMPSSRAEIFVPPQHGHTSAEFITSSYSTGPAGDDWPSARLAHVDFSPSQEKWTSALTVKTQPRRLMEATGLLGSAVTIDAGPTAGELPLETAPAAAARLPHGERESLQEHLHAMSAPEGIPSAPCTSLPRGHRRRIFFGVPSDNPDGFGAGYEEVDARGRPVPGTFQEIAPFDHSVINVCLPLAPGNKTANELWEIVNVSGEDHNFHIHQTKFQVLSTSDEAAPPSALMDNVPVLHGSDGCDGSVESWRSQACKVKSVFLRIPFSEVGDFVYHCHILEHEDGGMMAHIRVVPAH